MISLNIIKELIDYCFIGDDEKLISKVNEFEKNGVNIQQLIKNMINYLDDYALKNARKDYILFEKIKRLVFDLDNCYIEARTNENSYNILKLILLDFTFSFSDKKINKQEEKITKNDSQKLELRINNAFAGAKKSFLNSALKTWQDTDFTEFSLVNLNLFLPVVASDKYVIFSCDDDNMVNLFNSNLSDIEKELIKKGVKFRVYSITNNYWQEIKKDYIKNIKNGYRYELIEEKEIINKPKETKKGKINELFDNSEIKIIEKEGNDK